MITNSKGTLNTVLWPYIRSCLQGDPSNTQPLLYTLRSDRPLSLEGQKFLADLFDPNRPMGLYATIHAGKGRKAESGRNFMLLASYHSWLDKNDRKTMPQKEWEILAKRFGMDVPTAKRALDKARVRAKAALISRGKE